jgi:hypothetical protein
MARPIGVFSDVAVLTVFPGDPPELPAEEREPVQPEQEAGHDKEHFQGDPP